MTIVGLIIFFIIIFITGIYMNQKDKQEGILLKLYLIHLGGHPYLQSNDNIILQINDDNNVYIKNFQNKTISVIPINQITRYELKTEFEIQKDVTLTRLLALGIFAFGLKKKTEINNSYLILSYIQNNVPIDCIFKSAINNQQLGNIISTLNRLKIEQNNIEDSYKTV